MPPIRTPLRSIDRNIQGRGPELSPYERGKIEGARIAGMSPREIELHLDRSRSAVRGTIALEISRSNGESLPRTGRPIIYTDRDNRTMLRNLRLHPKSTFQERRDDTGLKMSNSTIKNLARLYGLQHWRAKKRPELTVKVAADRLLWAKCRAHWDVEKWKKYMWSDECSAERGRGKVAEWVWGIPSDKWTPEMVTTYKPGKQMRVMVWAAFWGNGERCPLYILSRDFEAKKHGYTANSYLEVLEERLLEHYSDDLIFMQDNAAIHTAGIVKEWFQDNGIHTCDWPLYSPDLNPIENAWWALKKKVIELFPHLLTAVGNGEQDRIELEEALKNAWSELPNSLFESLVESMPRRVLACIAAKGWHTKY
jgi:transposase